MKLHVSMQHLKLSVLGGSRTPHAAITGHYGRESRILGVTDRHKSNILDTMDICEKGVCSEHGVYAPWWLTLLFQAAGTNVRAT